MVKIEDKTKKYDYYAVEVEAPKEYSLSLNAIKVSGDQYSDNVIQATLKDDIKTELPATGSEKLLLIGASLAVLGVLGAGVYYFKANKVN